MPNTKKQTKVLIQPKKAKGKKVKSNMQDWHLWLELFAANSPYLDQQGWLMRRHRPEKETRKTMDFV